MNKTKIEWCDVTWNPVTGCLHACPYCYARKMSKRFAGDIRQNLNDKRCIKEGAGIFVLNERFDVHGNYPIAFPFGFAPTLHKYRLNDPKKKAHGTNVFVCSMADLFGDWVPENWIEQVFNACKEAPQHNYLFLTKNPKMYRELYGRDKLPQTDNMWYGSSFTRPTEIHTLANDSYKTFVSLEPLLGDIGFELQLRDEKVADWVIIGAETGQNKNKVVPTKAWINHIVEYCDDFHIPVFMKDSLINIVGAENMRREYPEQLLKFSHILTKDEMLNSYCGVCKKELPKKEMTTILGRKKRCESTYTIGYVCKDCITDFERNFNINGTDNRGGGA